MPQQRSAFGISTYLSPFRPFKMALGWSLMFWYRTRWQGSCHVAVLPSNSFLQGKLFRFDLQHVDDELRRVLDLFLELAVPLLLLLVVRQVFLVVLQSGAARAAGSHDIVDVLEGLYVLVRQAASPSRNRRRSKRPLRSSSAPSAPLPRRPCLVRKSMNFNPRSG